MISLTTLALLGIVIALIYIFLVWNFNYWSKFGIKQAKAYPFLGSFPSQFTQKRHLVYDVDDIYKQFKYTDHFVGVINCRSPQLLICSPEIAHKVFVNDFRYFHDNEFTLYTDRKKDILLSNNPFVLCGEEWKQRRAEVTPGLTMSRLTAVYPVTLQVVQNLSNFIRQQMKIAPPDGLNVKQLCLRYTTDVVSDSVLGIKAKSLTDEPTPIHTMIEQAFQQSTFFIIFMSLSTLVPGIRKFYLPRFFSLETQEFIVHLMKTSIELRRKTGDANRIDFLNYILQLQEKKKLSLEEVASHTMTFLIDGFETSASVLAHTLLLLARNPDVQQRLRDEIGTETLSIEQLTDLPYLEACIHESVRIFSPQLVSRKICTEPYELVNKDGTRLPVKPGDIIAVPVHSFHHDPDIFEDPESYKPERFLETNGGPKKYRDMGAYLGFGDGPRICLGMRFGLIIVKAALVQILRDFNVKAAPKTRKDNQLDDVYFLSLLKGGIWLKFEERN